MISFLFPLPELLLSGAVAWAQRYIVTNLFQKNGIFLPIYPQPGKSKKYLAKEWELRQCLKTIKLVVIIWNHQKPTKKD
ncbi:hypothetical protein [Okeania sp. SIO2B3]|uniref:hypothetical protein n=1 Tax=Okeania sp. SIO2B3 TaxID=2607784 RepID=UPI0013C21E55|nr:hypothetical protein [Okeania sp. SIO2B3]NET47159.1 hypothetical protein [Okeania sp. SIO2B3]